MLTRDSVTVATEVPVYLFPEDIQHLKRKLLKFHVPFDDNATLTGHFDVLQLGNGAIHVLDYKPNTRRESLMDKICDVSS